MSSIRKDKDNIFFNLEPCPIPNSPEGFFKFGSKCIKIEDSSILLNHVEGLAHCADQYGGELLTLNSNDQFDEVLKYVEFEESYFLSSGSDRMQDGVVQWQDGMIFCCLCRAIFKIVYRFDKV